MGDEYTCRTCGKTSELEDNTDLFPLFTSTDYHNELKMILSEFEIWNLNISENDGLPQKICLTCFDSFCQIHNFRVMCEEAQMNFGELCTGLDIIIKMEPESSGNMDSEFPEDFEGEQIVTIQEHYQFPRDTRPKVSEPPAEEQKTVDLLEKKPIGSVAENMDIDDKEKARQEEIDEMNAEVPEFKPYRCEFCMDIVSFDDPDLLNDHYNALHSTETPYLCPKCDKCFDSKFKRNVHAKAHYRILVECDICGKKVRGGKPMLAQHNELHHIEIDRECLTCGKIFPKATLKTFNYHMSWHDDAKLHKCKYCEKKFIQITHLVVHEKSHTGACVYQCYECGIGFANETLLKEHNQAKGHSNDDFPGEVVEQSDVVPKVDPNKKANQCEICKKPFRSMLNLRLHMFKKHGTKPTASVRQLIKQRQNLAIIKPFKCSKCPESFLMHTQLVMHLKSHDENKSHKCPTCSKPFKKEKYLKCHIDTVHLKKKDHVCGICGWAFVYRQSLDEHIAVKHSNTKDFICEICEKAFAFEKALKNHMLTHKEEKPFACTVCSKSFRQSCALKDRIRSITVISVSVNFRRHLLASVLFCFDLALISVSHTLSKALKMSAGDKICRTCGKGTDLKDETVLFPIFNPPNFESELKIILEEFETWNLNIAENDGLPQQICLTCFDSFCQIHNFRVLCVETQMNFGEMCTGLDIIIKDQISDEDSDSPEHFNFEELVIVQEHYKFPGDEIPELPELPKPELPELPKPSPTLTPTDPVDTIKQEPPEPVKNPEPKKIIRPNYDPREVKDILPEYREHQCDYCLDVVCFDNEEQLSEHVNLMHSTSEPYTCPKCDKRFDKKAKRNNHSRIHFAPATNCQTCGRKVRGGENMMLQHIEYCHIEKDRVCPTCGKEFKMISLKRFNYHLTWHDESRLHKCKFCDKKFIQTTHLVVHERTHTGESPYKCDKCQMAFKNPNLLANHIKGHGGKDITCPECPKRFHHRHALTMHMTVHDPRRKRPHCEICNITYRTAINLRLHNYQKHDGPASESILNILSKRQIKHPVIKPYKCNLCPEAFVLHTQLVKHLKMHTEDRPFSCKLCIKTFKRVAHLKLHMDSLHLNKKPFKCALCGWAFPQRNNLKEHFAAKHANTRDFKCDICSKDFATPKALRIHKVTHSEKKPFVCTVCNRSFKQMFVLKNHMNRHLRKNEADIEGGDITDIVVRDEIDEEL
ncbi:zinc finger protein 226-like [Eupeodes corollae]|uniref:zinc finger protein 226-like n=1 Tax=Eupeodes corollae TaxID=290404 RepID=UPI002493CDE8|nr:zinc finger protein 226-like [Eupeodes corollae]